MSEPHQGERPAGDEAPRRSTSWWPVVLPVATFLVGLLLGGVVMGVAADDDDSPSAESRPTSSASPEDAGGTPGQGTATTVVVPDECIAVADTVEEATRLTRRMTSALRDFDADQLRDQLRQLETLDQQARDQVRACREIDVDESPTP